MYLVQSPHLPLYLLVFLDSFFFCLHASLLMPTVCGVSNAAATQAALAFRAVYVLVCQDLSLLLCSKLNVRTAGGPKGPEQLDLCVSECVSAVVWSLGFRSALVTNGSANFGLL